MVRTMSVGTNCDFGVRASREAWGLAMAIGLLPLTGGAWAEPASFVLPAVVSAVGPAFVTQGSRWTTTATDGTVQQGQAFTLTYSFVPDGTTIQIPGETAAPSNLFATLDANFPGGQAAWKARFAQAFAEWSKHANITYMEVGDDGAAFPSSPGLLAGTGVDGRGDVRIAMIPQVEIRQGVTFYPQFGGDTVLNSSQIGAFIDPGAANDFRVLLNAVMRQHGNGLGLRTVVSDDSDFLMEQGPHTAFLGPQEDDIRGVQFIYGDRFEPNEQIGEEVFVGGPLRDPIADGVQLLDVQGVSLGHQNDTDWYAFTAFAGVPIALRVEPVGTTYSSGPQGGAQTAVDARAVRNLGLRLWRRVSAQTNEIALLAQINFNTAGQDEYHPPITYALAGYMLAEIFSTDGVNDVQRYRLRISNAEIQPAPQSPSMSVFETAAGVEFNDGDTVGFGTVEVGEIGNKTLTIVNSGAGPLELGSIGIAGPAAGDYAFSLIGLPTLPPNDTRALAISFSPAETGERSAVMVIPNDDPSRPNFSVVLSGTGTGSPLMEVLFNDVVVENNGNFDFGNVEIGGTGTASLLIRNTGSAQLSVTSLGFSGADAMDFATTILTANLVPGGSVAGQVSFTPTADGSRTTLLSIGSNAGTYAAGLQGNGLADCNDLVDGCEAGQQPPLDGDEAANGNNNNGAVLPPSGFSFFPCGAGFAGLLPLTLAGLCSLRLCVPRSKKRERPPVEA